MVVGPVKTQAVVEETQLSTNLPCGLNLRLQEEVTLRPTVTYHLHGAVGVRAVQVSQSSVNISILTNLRPRCTQLTERQDVVVRHQLSEHERTAYRGIEVAALVLGKGRRPVITAGHSQEQGVAPAGTSLTEDAHHALAAVAVAELLVLIRDIGKADGTCSNEVITPVVLVHALGVISAGT